MRLCVVPPSELISGVPWLGAAWVDIRVATALLLHHSDFVILTDPDESTISRTWARAIGQVESPCSIRVSKRRALLRRPARTPYPSACAYGHPRRKGLGDELRKVNSTGHAPWSKGDCVCSTSLSSHDGGCGGLPASGRAKQDEEALHAGGTDEHERGEARPAIFLVALKRHETTAWPTSVCRASYRNPRIGQPYRPATEPAFAEAVYSRRTDGRHCRQEDGEEVS